MFVAGIGRRESVDLCMIQKTSEENDKCLMQKKSESVVFEFWNDEPFSKVGRAAIYILSSTLSRRLIVFHKSGSLVDLSRSLTRYPAQERVRRIVQGRQPGWAAPRQPTDQGHGRTRRAVLGTRPRALVGSWADSFQVHPRGYGCSSGVVHDVVFWDL